MLTWANLYPAQGQGVAQEGYKFLLRDAYSQLWVLLRRYIANAEQRSGAACSVTRMHALSSGSPPSFVCCGR